MPHDVREMIPHDVREMIPHDVREMIPHDVREMVPHHVREAITHDVREMIPHDVREMVPHDVREAMIQAITQTITDKEKTYSLPSCATSKKRHLLQQRENLDDRGACAHAVDVHDPGAQLQEPHCTSTRSATHIHEQVPAQCVHSLRYTATHTKKYKL